MIPTQINKDWRCCVWLVSRLWEYIDLEIVLQCWFLERLCVFRYQEAESQPCTCSDQQLNCSFGVSTTRTLMLFATHRFLHD